MAKARPLGAGKTSVLIYLEPWIEMGNPAFRVGAFKNQMGNLARKLIANEYDVRVLVGEGVGQRSRDLDLGILDDRLTETPLRDLFECYDSYFSANTALMSERTCMHELARYGRIVTRNLPATFAPDVIVSWESPIQHLRALYPDALPLHLMPGFTSRAPFPELVSLDPCGYYAHSLVATQGNLLTQFEASDEDLTLLARIRQHYLDGFLQPANPFPRDRLDPSGRFKHLILVPLQVSGYFSFDGCSNYRNGLDLVLDVLQRVGPDVGLVVTQYVTHHTSDRVMSPDVLAFMSDRYPNVIFDPDFDRVDGVSQFLLAAVDGVACVTSSIGYQALLWQKPVFAFGHSPLRAFSCGTSSKEIAEALRERKTRQFDGALARILTHTQPLAATVMESDWFVDFLPRALRRYRSGKRGLDIMEAVRPPTEYASEFIGAGRLARARQKTAVALAAPANTTKSAIEVVAGAAPIVSFDIFDTLIERPIARPIDVFQLMAGDVQRLSGGLVEFPTDRVHAERLCRERVLDAAGMQVREITFDEIYDELARLTGTSFEQLHSIKELELRTEKRILRPRPAGVAAYRAAKALDKQVILVSDMYLSEDFVRSVLTNLGFSSDDRLFISSREGVRKHENKLFEKVVEELDTDPSSILHIGDNPKGDRECARAVGLKAHLLPRALNVMLKNSALNRTFRTRSKNPTLAESVWLGIVATRLFGNDPSFYATETHFNGDPFALGYLGLGPFFLGFVKWIIEESARDGIEVLYFLSRDGEILQRVFEQLVPNYANAPRAKYLLSSRRSAQVAAIFEVADIKRVGLTPFRGHSLARYLDTRFGIATANLEEDLPQRFGFNSWEDRIKSIATQRAALQVALAIADVILENARQERIHYAAYLKQQGLEPGVRAAVVDIGYAGTMQLALRDIAGTAVSGYYLMTFLPARRVQRAGLPCKAYAGNFVERQTSSHPVARHGLMLETVFSNDEDSFVCFKSSSDGTKATFVKSEGSAARRRLIRRIREGIHAFVADVLDVYDADLDALEFDCDSTLAAFVDFLENPSSRDAAMFEGVVFDDEFGGAGVRFVVPPFSPNGLTQHDSDSSIWPQGVAALDRDWETRRASREPAPSATSTPETSGPNTPAMNKQVTSEERQKLATRKPAKRSGGEWRGPGASAIAGIIRSVAGPAKARKFERDPQLFFEDSKHPWARALGRTFVRRQR